MNRERIHWSLIHWLAQFHRNTEKEEVDNDVLREVLAVNGDPAHQPAQSAQK